MGVRAMLLVQLLLVAAAVDPGSTIELAPAPGASPVKTLTIAGQPVALDPEGRARIPANSNLAAPGMRFYTVGERAFYYPADDTLVTWTLACLDRGSDVEVVVKDHGSESWEKSLTFTAPLETAEASRRVRFALAPGPWDLSILVPGYAPAFAADVRVTGASTAVSPSKLARAAHLKGRILDARNGKPPTHWSAYLRRVGADSNSDEARFFDSRPIAADRRTLDYASLPTGGWELKVIAPGRGRRETLVSAPRPGAVADLGDFYISQSGAVRVTLAFPSEIPTESFVVRLRREALDPGQPAIELGKKTLAPKPETALEFPDLEPGVVTVVGESASGGIQRRDFTTVKSGETADVRLTFVPIHLHGRVKRGDVAVPGALVRAGVTGRPDKDPSATSDDFGDYSLRFWAARNDVFLTTTVSGNDLPFAETVALEPEATEVEHDVQLPAGEIRGVVRDAETGAPVRGATVSFSSPPPRAGDAPEGIRFNSGSETDGEGRFSLTNLLPKPIDVEVKSEGYSPAKFPAVVPTPEGVDLDVRLEKGLRLVGTITDEAGAPMAGATVGIDPNPEGYFFTRTTLTSPAGEFEYRSTGPGPHLLGVFRCGSTLVLRTVSLEPATAESNERREDVQLAPELNPIAVHMEDEAGRPIANSNTWWAIDGVALPLSDFDRAARHCGQPSTTDAQGNLTLRGFPRGNLSFLDFETQRPLGSFTNDGSQSVWTIRIPRGNNPHDATAPPAR
ncbi:MAG: carboxypeptidase-like regulatory domain-containing protein [Thermoanaerobaculia bacterium]